MENTPDKQYILADIMKKRKKDKIAVENKIKNKMIIKSKRKKNQKAMKAPEKFIKQYLHQQKSYQHYRLKNQHNKKMRITKNSQAYGVGQLLLVVRVRGTTDISNPQKIILSKLNLKKVNTAVFIKGTATNIRLLKRVENYITWGEPTKQLVSELIYKKLHGKVGNQRIPIKSNAQVEQYIGGDIICLEDIINEVTQIGPNFQQIMEFIFPFKLTTPEGTLASRLRKPVGDNGHWGYRGQDINEYVEVMI